MAFDGFVTKAVVTELKNTIIGAKVNKVFEPTKNEVILGLYNNGINYTLNLCANPDFCRICLTTHSKPNPQNAYNYCMLLRKYLIGGKIINISNYDLERTIEIQFECYNDLNDLVVRKLFIEVMSRQSNIILTNENNIIIDTLKHFDNNVRELLPAHEYVFTPIAKTSFLEKNLNEFIDIIKKDENNSLVKILTNTFIGFSKTFCVQTLNLLNIEDTNYSDTDLEKLFNYINELIKNMGTSSVSCKLIDNKDYALILNLADSYDYDDEYYSKSALHVNFFLDDFYSNKENTSIFINSRNALLKIVSASLKKVYKKLENINSKLKECEHMDTFRLYGELLTANLYKFNPDSNISEITVENYYNENKTITIPLDKSISVQKNIQKYFKKYNKLKNALAIVSEQKKEAEKELDYIESIVFNLSNAKTMNDINEVYEEISENVTTKKELSKKSKNKISKKKSTSKDIELEKIDFEGYTIYIGKNNIQNDYISLKFSNPNDIWFHTQKIHGSHILLRNSENLDLADIPETVLFKCACLAKENSKASKALNVSVDYCYSKFVKKAAGSKPGMVIYNNFKTIIVK